MKNKHAIHGQSTMGNSANKPYQFDNIRNTELQDKDIHKSVKITDQREFTTEMVTMTCTRESKTQIQYVARNEDDSSIYILSAVGTPELVTFYDDRGDVIAIIEVASKNHMMIYRHRATGGEGAQERERSFCQSRCGTERANDHLYV